MGQVKTVHPPVRMMHLEGRSFISEVLMPKMYNLNLIMKEHQTNPN